MAVTEFERHVSGSPAVAESPEARVAIEPEVKGLLPRKYFIFFDFAFNSPIGAIAAVRAAQHFIDTEAATGDEVAVLSYSAAKGLKVHEFLTNDLAKARQAMAGISAKEISGRAEEIEREYWDLRGYTTSDTSDPFLRRRGAEDRSRPAAIEIPSPGLPVHPGRSGQGHAVGPRE